MTSPNDEKQPGTDLAEALKQLGGIKQTFGPDPVIVIVGVLFAVAITCGSGGLFYAGYGKIFDGPVPDYGNGGAAIGMGVVALAIAVGIGFYVRYLRSQRIFLCPNGVVRLARSGVTCYPWEEIERFTRIIIKDHVPLKYGLSQLAPIGTSSSYSVLRKDGESFTVTKDDVNRLGKLAKALHEEATRRNIPWVVETL